MLSEAPRKPPEHGPELFFGIAGAVGTDLEMVTRVLEDRLAELGYRSQQIRLSSLLDLLDWSGIQDPPEIDDETIDEHISTRMEAGDRLREVLGRGDALALLAILRVTQLRPEPKQPAARTAYILRSLKHPQEVETLREVYGPNFFMISAYSPVGTRAAYLEAKITQDWEKGALSSSEASPEGTARNLIERDMREGHRLLGQRLADTFPKADFFVDARHRPSLEKDLRRFVELLFDHPFHTPTRHENAMFHAHAAALRSAAPGRQVGCAIAAPDGDVLAVGTNEVPKPGGGQYWPEDTADERDHNRDDPDVSGSEKSIVIEQILRRLKDQDWLREEQSGATGEQFDRLLEGMRIQGLIEFERAMHAEMGAIVLAARRGISVGGSFLYTTTFPCHECTRHLIGAGISRVFYIEPYPKSLAARLHDDAIVIDPSTPPNDKVAFLPFVGVAPRRYLGLFTPSPRVRKDAQGRVASARPGWFPKGVPGGEPTKLEKTDTSEEAGSASERLGETSASNDTFGLEEEPSDVPAKEEEAVETDVVDLSEDSGVVLAPVETAVEHTSDRLYTIRETNVLVELDDALETSGVELNEGEE